MARTRSERGKRVAGGGRVLVSSYALSNTEIWSPLLPVFSFNLQSNSLFHYRDNAGDYLFIARDIMMDVFQSASTLIRSARTLAQSVSTPLIITHDCCDLVPTPRQLGLRLRTISYREMEGRSKITGRERKSKEKRERGKGSAGEVVKGVIEEIMGNIHTHTYVCMYLHGIKDRKKHVTLRPV